ncbi:hypothetical protein SAMN04487777_11738 [Priestia aryabhattai B8W22]|uniref:hypothetical protein n=1 Tax=Priestia aryabhattai TaxID=412384 RepID=UPI0008896CEF|nr:hypothetical protein SAMN04487777_11738 [Priestia aryabhattai B8W22]
MDKAVWDTIRFFIGDEMDKFFEGKKVSEDSFSIILEQKELNELYFNIKERVEKQFNIEE